MFLKTSDYKGLHFSPNILFLYIHRVIVQMGTGLISVFLPIFYLEKLGSPVYAILVFIVSFLSYALLVPFGARWAVSGGMKYMMVVGMPFFALSLVSLSFLDRAPALFLSFHLLLLLIYRLMYWVPFHVDFALFTDKKTRGRQLAALRSITTVVLAVTPLIGGAVIGYLGFNILFYAALVLFLFSLIPLMQVEERKEEFQFGYFETFRELFSGKHRRTLFAYAGDGMQGAVRIAIWPIFIFALLDGEYIRVGLLTSLTIAVLIILRLFIGDLADKWDRKKLLTLSALIYTTGWIMKVFVQTGLHIFIADTYHRFGNTMSRTSVDTTMYEHAADNGHYIDEYTVLREVALNLGRVLVLVVTLTFFGFFGLTASFLVAAFASLSVVLLARENVFTK